MAADDAFRPKSLKDYEAVAKKRLKPSYWEYYDAPGPAGRTYADSIEAFRRYKFRPQIMTDAMKRTMTTTIIGQTTAIPIGIAPTALHRFAHEDMEFATARGAAAAGTILIVSSFSTVHVAELSRAVPDAKLWMQVYIFEDKRITESTVRQAERAGFKAIVLTVDSGLVGWNIDEFRRAFQDDECLSYPNLDIGLPEQVAARKKSRGDFISYFGYTQFRPNVTWKHVKWLKSLTSLPIICKGILDGRAARLAVDAGADGIIVSAHGGRQLDDVASPIDALAEVVDSVRGRGVPVMMDGGVRSGLDVLKALALGANFVFVGRPILWGLACEGARGVEGILNILSRELDYAMALCGCSDATQIPSSVVVHESHYKLPRAKL